MNIESALKSQYHAALKTLRHAIEKCPDALWDDPADGAAPFWRVVYHTLFYTHFYLQQDQQSFIPWVKHREEVECLDDIPGTTHALPISVTRIRATNCSNTGVSAMTRSMGASTRWISPPQGAGFRGTRCRRLNTRSSTSDTPSITRPHCRLACAVPPALASIGLAGMKRGGRVVDETTRIAIAFSPAPCDDPLLSGWTEVSSHGFLLSLCNRRWLEKFCFWSWVGG